MKNEKNIKLKRRYSVPVIEEIVLDNSISLQLLSDAPVGPDESLGSTPEYFNNDMFKSLQA